MKPELAAIDARLMQECPPQTQIPPGPQTIGVVLQTMQTNQNEYGSCRRKDAALIKAVRTRDAIQGS